MWAPERANVKRYEGKLHSYGLPMPYQPKGLSIAGRIRYGDQSGGSAPFDGGSLDDRRRGLR
jgi:hypothetical protein